LTRVAVNSNSPVAGPRGRVHGAGFLDGGGTMRTLCSRLLALLAVGILVVGLQAADTKEVTLKGTILCAKCALKEAKKCQTAIQVKEAGKEVTYYFEDKGAQENYHESVCGGDRKAGTVVGTVAEKDGKKWVKPSKVEYAKN